MNNLRANGDYDVHPAMGERVCAIAADVFQTDASRIDLTMGPEDIDRWDSLNHLRLITEVENAFSIRLTMAQIQQIQSLDDIVKFASERGA